MNTYLDIILSCVLQQAGQRRIVFSCFDPDICTMLVQASFHRWLIAFGSRINQFQAAFATLPERPVNEPGIQFGLLQVLSNCLMLISLCFPQGASQAEQIPHPLPHSGNFSNVSWADGHPLPDHSDCHKFCPEWEYSGELLWSYYICIIIYNRVNGTLRLQLWRYSSLVTETIVTPISQN